MRLLHIKYNRRKNENEKQTYCTNIERRILYKAKYA